MKSKQALEYFLEYIQSEISAGNNTVIAYENDLKDFLNFIGSIELPEISSRNIENYIKNLKENGFKATTINRKISSIRHFFNFLISEKVIIKSPVSHIELLKQEKKIPKFLTKEEVKILLENVRDYNSDDELKLCVMMEILYATGMRVSELVGLKNSSIKFNGNKIEPYLIVIGKGNKERLVPLHSKAIQSIQYYINKVLKNNLSNKFLFPSNSKEGHFTRQRFGQLLKELALKSNLSPSKISPHIIRHSFATHMLDNGADLRVIQEILGHSDISTTEIYTHTVNQKLKKVLETYHPFAKR